MDRTSSPRPAGRPGSRRRDSLRVLLISLIGISLSLGLPSGQTAPMLSDQPVSTKSLPEAGLVEVRFVDSSVLKLTLLEEHIEITTRYGRLMVPVQEVRRIEVGMRFPPGTSRRLEAALGNLGSGDFRQREAATADLLALRELAYPSLLKVQKSGDAEVAKRAHLVLEKLREAIPAEKLVLREFDILHTDDFPIHGRIEKSSFKARSPYFGELQIRLSDLRHIRSLTSGSSAELVVEASRHGLVQEQWFDCRIELSEGAPLTVTASGEVDVYPLGGDRGTYIVGPKGPKRWGNDPGRALDPPSGTLLGRIGLAGKVFNLGENFDGAAPGSGRLYLRIMPSPWGVPPTGNYVVKVKGGTKTEE